MIFENFSPISRKTDAAFDLPVYRLETEREKLSRREPQTRITEKIHYFEQLLENGGLLVFLLW